MVRSMQGLWDVSRGGSEPVLASRGRRSSMGWLARVQGAIRRCLDWFVEY